MPSLSSLTPAGRESLDKLLHDSVASRKVPATWFGVTNAKETIYFNCDGKLDFDANEKSPDVDETTMLQMFSSTKFVTTVASLQLVDSGLLALDDVELIQKHLPELSHLQILKGHDEAGQPIWETPTNKITLRQLLSHTSGLTYSFNNQSLAKWVKDNNVNPMFFEGGASEKTYLFPLAFNPGTAWAYGVGLDWAGILIARVTGKTLEQQYKESIFDKAGMPDTTFYPTDEVKRRLIKMTQQDPVPDSPLSNLADNFTALGPLARESDPSKISDILSGGGGLFSTAKDYLAFLRGVMASQSGDDPKALLSAKSFQELFTDSLAEDASYENFFASTIAQDYHDPALYKHAEGEPRRIGHSVGLVINKKDSCYGRNAGSGCWDGAAKTQYWLDPEAGLAAVCMTNVWTFGPNDFIRLYNQYERTLYDALSDSSNVEPMPSPSRLEVSHRFLFKPLDDVQDGGCNAAVWLPVQKGNFPDGAPVAMQVVRVSERYSHGGGWLIGSSLEVPYHQIRWWLDRGIVVISLEYRLGPHVGLKEIKEDLLDSYRYVAQGGLERDLQAAGSEVSLDVTCICAHGASAGATNTIFLASEIGKHNEHAGIAAALPELRAIVPTYALTQYNVLNDPSSVLKEAAQNNLLIANAVKRVEEQQCQTAYEVDVDYLPRLAQVLAGTAGEETDLDRANFRTIYAVVNKGLVTMLSREEPPYSQQIAPLDLITATFPPICVVEATADALIPPIQSQKLYYRALQHEVDARLVKCHGMTHGEAEFHERLPPWKEDRTYWQTAVLPSLEFAYQRLTRA